MKKKISTWSVIHLSILVGILLVKVISHLMQDEPTTGERFYRSLDKFSMTGISAMKRSDLTIPYVMLNDSGSYLTLDIVPHDTLRSHEVYELQGDVLYQFMHRDRDGDTTRTVYKYIFRDTIMTYVYQGDTTTPDEHHYIISLSLETTRRKVECHFYPFMHSLRPAPVNILSSIDKTWMDRKTTSINRIDHNILKVDQTMHDYAADSTSQRYLLYDLRKYPMFYLDYVPLRIGN